MRSGSRERYAELDGLRGIAAGAVVLYHLFFLYDVYFKPASAPPPVRFSWGLYGVQLFFLISGYVILLTARRTGSARDFAVARFTRLFPTYWACLTLSWLTVLLAGVAGLQRTPFEIAVNYTMLQRLVGVREVDGVYWSLSVELVFYAVVLVLLLRLRSLDARVVRRLVVAWSAFAVLVAAVAHVAPEDAVVQRLLVLSAAEYAPLFGLGMLLLLSREVGRLERLVGPTGAAAGLVTWLLRGTFAMAVVLVLCAAFAFVVMRPGFAPLRWRPLVFVGSISYPLYLVHQNVGYVVLQGLVGRVDRTVASLAAIVVTGTLAWVVHVTVEGPLSRRLRRVLDRRRTPADVIRAGRSSSHVA